MKPVFRSLVRINLRNEIEFLNLLQTNQILDEKLFEIHFDLKLTEK